MWCVCVCVFGVSVGVRAYVRVNEKKKDGREIKYLFIPNLFSVFKEKEKNELLV